MRIIAVSARPTDQRRAALARLAQPVGDLLLVDPAELERLAQDGDDSARAVVLDGPLAPPSDALAAGLHRCVMQGTSLLAIGPAPAAGPDTGWAALLGVNAQPALPVTEVFAAVAETTDVIAARVDSEFPVVDALQPLSPVDDTARAVLQVRWRFCDQAAVVAVERGQGQVVVSGLGNCDEALACPSLATVLRRALRRRADLSPGRPPFGVGVLGYGPFGGMGFVHGTAVAITPGLELAAVADSDAGRRKVAEHDFPGIRVHTSVEELAADGEVEVAIVATPPVTHGPMAAALLAAGKHVVCEKPLCFSTAEADNLDALAREHGRVLTVNQSRRWDRDFAAAGQVVEAGLLGELFNVETFVGGFEHPCRTWHSEATVSGGVVYDWGAHHVDWIMALMGSAPTTVSAVGHKRVWHDVTNLDQLRVRMLWDDGREAQFLTSDVTAVRLPKFFLQGTAGTLVGRYQDVVFERIDAARGYLREEAHHAEAPAALTLARYESSRGVSDSAVVLAPERQFAFHRNLADHLHMGEPLAVTPTSARSVVAVLEAATRSAAVGGNPVALP